MLSKLFECESNKNNNYYRVIQTQKEYSDRRIFPIDEIVVSDNPVNLEADDRTKMGGFCVSTKEYIFRWLIRGNTLCEVIIPDDYKIYKTIHKSGIYIADHIILTNPKEIDDEFATQLYLQSKLLDIEYFKAMTACAICGYINTALKVCHDKVNVQNVDTALNEFNSFCGRRINENFIDNEVARNSITLLYNELIKIKNMNY